MTTRTFRDSFAGKDTLVVGEYDTSDAYLDDEHELSLQITKGQLVKGDVYLTITQVRELRDVLTSILVTETDVEDDEDAEEDVPETPKLAALMSMPPFFETKPEGDEDEGDLPPVSELPLGYAFDVVTFFHSRSQELAPKPTLADQFRVTRNY